MLETQQHKG